MPYALLVDGDRATRANYRVTLELDGWDVDEHDNGVTAIAAMRDHRPDVVLLALHPPHVGGLRLLQEMLLDDGLREIPRVVVSRIPDAVERTFALGLGAAAWLSAPISPQRLLAAAWDHHSDVDRSTDDAEPVPPA